MTAGGSEVSQLTSPSERAPSITIVVVEFVKSDAPVQMRAG